MFLSFGRVGARVAMKEDKRTLTLLVVKHPLLWPHLVYIILIVLPTFIGRLEHNSAHTFVVYINSNADGLVKASRYQYLCLSFCFIYWIYCRRQSSLSTLASTRNRYDCIRIFYRTILYSVRVVVRREMGAKSSKRKRRTPRIAYKQKHTDKKQYENKRRKKHIFCS